MDIRSTSPVSHLTGTDGHRWTFHGHSNSNEKYEFLKFFQRLMDVDGHRWTFDGYPHFRPYRGQMDIDGHHMDIPIFTPAGGRWTSMDTIWTSPFSPVAEADGPRWTSYGHPYYDPSTIPDMSLRAQSNILQISHSEVCQRLHTHTHTLYICLFL